MKSTALRHMLAASHDAGRVVINLIDSLQGTHANAYLGQCPLK